MANLLKGASTKAAGNTLSQEAFISKLNTEGALDEGSGFSRAYQSGETDPQYEARLEEWKRRKKGGGAAPPPPSAPASPAMAAISKVTGGGAPGGMPDSESVDSGGGAAISPNIGPSIMAGITKALGRRIPPSNAYVLGPRPY